MAASPPADQPVQQLERGPRPQLQEGYIQDCKGYLKRRTKILKRWKKEWVSVNPGLQTTQICAGSDSRQLLYEFPTATPSLRIECLSSDPVSKDFFVFSVINSETGEELNRFRTENLVQMRKFMASLGSMGSKLFTQKMAENEIPIEATHGKWDVIHPSEDELIQRQQLFDAYKKEEAREGPIRPSDAPPTYAETIHQLPIGFYFPKDTGISLPSEMALQVAFPGQAMPIYNPTVSLPKAIRRPWHDTFRPPHGPPTFFPVSIGYGSEVGLQPGLQALWDPVSKTYFFLDHFRQITFYEDPRPAPQPKPVVQLQKHAYGDRRREVQLPAQVSTDQQIVGSTAQRAHSKQHGAILLACGVDGQNGASGCVGSRGSDGHSGCSGAGSGSAGQHGGAGHSGGPGSDGRRGRDGTEASDVVVNLAGDANALQVNGTTSFTAQLGGTQAEEVLFVNCRGGNGGYGGRGGDGGAGGSGGRGGNGGHGQSGFSSASGPGGNGGDGGNAGFGGKCVIQSVDPHLLILVEADCTAGNKGLGGEGGSGGTGGSGGSGGSGGHGGSGGSGGSYRDANGNTHTYPCGSSGHSGSRGHNGTNGSRGANGYSGSNGQSAHSGGILWVISSPSGNVLQQAATRYDATVTKLKVTSAIDDGIFEPNERIAVSDVTVINSGGLSLPTGCQAFMPSTTTIKFEPTRFDLPELLPDHVCDIPVTFYGRIFDQPPPNVPGPFVSSAEFSSRIELLGRPFEKSFLHQKLVVQYPVKLSYLKCSENLGRGEVSQIEVGVENISSLPYGGCPGSGGRVVLQIHFDARLIPLGAACTDLTTLPYSITYDPNTRDSMFIEMQHIPARETVNVQVSVQMESRAELFDQCYWQADLYLRDKLIEYNFQRIRVSPFYLPKDPPADVLMVTDEHITRKDFVFWQKILELAKVTVDFWDTTRYNGLSVDLITNARHSLSWEGRYSGRLILYPYCNLDLLWGIDIARHFHGENHRDEPLKELNSSMVLFLPPSQPHLPEADKYSDHGDKEVIHHLSAIDATIELPENVTYSGFHLTMPGASTCFPLSICQSNRPYINWEEKQLKKLEKENPSQAATVLARHTNIASAGLFRYSYGTVDIRRIPMLRSSKLLVVDGAGGSMTSIGLDDLNLLPSSNEVPLASNFGQVFLATLFGLPMRCKLALLKNSSEEPASSAEIMFTLPNGPTLSRAELVMICAASEIADDLFNCSGAAQRMSEFAQEFENNTTEYVQNGNIILAGMALIKEEGKERKKRLKINQVSRALNEMLQLVNSVEQALSNSGVDTSNLQPLLSLHCLMDTERVHRSCQHFVKAGRWNIPG